MLPPVSAQLSPSARWQGVSPAHASTFTFDICPYGHEGVVGGHTSCAFAENIRSGYHASGRSNVVIAYSPVTGERYEMFCYPNYSANFSNGATVSATRCDGSNNAAVVIW